MEKKDIKKMFPHLFEELEGGEVKIPIDAVRKDPLAAEEEVESGEYACDECQEPIAETTEPDKLRHFNPQAVDFLRRCDTEAQAEEIICYLEKRGEITKEYADKLRCQMKKDGIRCFGPKKEENHYFKEGGLC